MFSKAEPCGHGRGEGVSQMSMLLHKPYLVKWSTKGEGGQKSPKKLSTWFMDAPEGHRKTSHN